MTKLKRIYFSFDSKFFNIFKRAIKDINYPDTKRVIKMNTGEIYQFDIQYDEENHDNSGIDVHQIIET